MLTKKGLLEINELGNVSQNKNSNMLRTILICICIILFYSCDANEGGRLVKALEEIYSSDQKYRKYLYQIDANETLRDSLANVFDTSTNDVKGRLYFKIDSIDKRNIQTIEKIIDRFGYPGKSMVGEPLNRTAFYVIQHNPEYIPKYFSMLDSLGRINEIDRVSVAMLEDRMLIEQDLPQKYGTQIHCDFTINQDTREEESCFIYPIENPKHVNKRRKEVGFTNTIEEYAEQNGVEYKNDK